ncbi:MAG: hypothetical protein LBQ68_00280 [Clostridiales bacterium]|nr:hypothetical protein [Clostridiales bacterium]
MAVIGVIGDPKAVEFLGELRDNAILRAEIIDLSKKSTRLPLEADFKPDIVLIGSGTSGENRPGGGSFAESEIESYEKYFNDNIVLINPENKEFLPLVASWRGLLITYGFNNKVCVTVSSVSDKDLQICIQRELPSLNNKIQEQQEFCVAADMERYSAESVLAAITASLAAGVEVRVLNSVTCE